MSSDYAQILEQNIREYGEGTRHLAFLSRLYSENAHFIFELLQNAEDARADKVEFTLHPERLEVRHNGRVFSEADVRGICGVADSTKTEDLTQIGKFGVGFKSVYTYTTSPEIHSGDEHFRIEHYVRPYEMAVCEPGQDFTTLFSFPFTRGDKPAEKAFAEIAERLRKLGVRTLLFLRNIQHVAWSIAGVASGLYLREERALGSARRIQVIGETDEYPDQDEETWLAFNQPVTVGEDNKLVSVEAAFLLAKDAGTGKEGIVRTGDTPLFVFFPTDKQTHLGFLIQGPYRTTPARDNVPSADAQNQLLIEETAKLVASSLPVLRDMGLMNLELLQALPIAERHFYPGSMFRPIFEQVRASLQSNDLLPTASGTYRRADQVKIARSIALRELLSDTQLRELCASQSPLYWLLDGITNERTTELYQYLRTQLNIEEIVPESFAGKLDGAFLLRQSDGWMVEFYAFLLNQRALWRSVRPVGILRSKPIIRLESGKHVLPFRESGVPNAYLPGNQLSTLPLVRRDIATAPVAADFLQQLGLTEPDSIAELREIVLPPYRGDDAVSIAQHSRDMQRIAAALRTDSRTKRTNIVSMLKETPFVLVENLATGKQAYAVPGEVYLSSEKYLPYFIEVASVWFLAEDAAVAAAIPDSVWHELGARRRPRIVNVETSLSDAEKRALRGGTDCSYDTGIEDYSLDGLDVVLEKMPGLTPPDAFEVAQILWAILIEQLDENPYYSAHQFFEGVYSWTYYRQRSAPFTANWIEALKAHAWLPGATNLLVTPGEIALVDLPEDFAKDARLVDLLGLGSHSLATTQKVAALAEETGVPFELPEMMRGNQDEFAEFARELKRRRECEQIARQGSSPTSFASSLVDAFLRPGETEILDDLDASEVSDVVGNPERRRERTLAEIIASQASEPMPNARYRHVPRSVLEAKNGEVRVFLQEQYRGRCQICDAVFPKRDGMPYFEGLYLVRHSDARWHDRPGNVLCLCPTCCAKLQFGAVSGPDIESQILAIRLGGEGGNGQAAINLQLCGTATRIRFTERHILDMQEMLKSSLVAASQEIEATAAV